MAQDGKQLFVDRCERLDAALRAQGYVLSVAEVEVMVWVGLAAECELAGLDDHAEWAKQRASQRLQDCPRVSR